MNYLAHFHLSKNSKPLIVGNFVADFVRGRDFSDFGEDIAKGIKMHREIDTFTDAHPIVFETKKRLFERYHKYAGVVVDIYYDHILAKHWDNFSDDTLSVFADNIYSTLFDEHSILPGNAQVTLKYMHKGNWLNNYASYDGIQRTLTGLSRRTKYNSGIENSVNELKRDLELITDEFNSFYPELIAHVDHYHVGDN